MKPLDTPAPFGQRLHVQTGVSCPAKTCKHILRHEFSRATARLNTCRTCNACGAAPRGSYPPSANAERGDFHDLVEPALPRATPPLGSGRIQCLRIKRGWEGWHRPADFGQGRVALRNSQPATQVAWGGNPNLVWKTLRAGTRSVRRPGSKVVISRKLADPGLEGMRLAEKKVFASRPLESSTIGNPCRQLKQIKKLVEATDTKTAGANTVTGLYACKWPRSACNPLSYQNSFPLPFLKHPEVSSAAT